MLRDLERRKRVESGGFPDGHSSIVSVRFGPEALEEALLPRLPNRVIGSLERRPFSIRAFC
jgi:hypothetical protein